VRAEGWNWEGQRGAEGGGGGGGRQTDTHTTKTMEEGGGRMVPYCMTRDKAG
jgi:hypothetical protein